MAADEVRAAVEGHPEVVAAYTVAGEASAVLVVRASDTRHLEQLLERLREHKGVLRTQTQIVLSTLFERPLRLDADRGAALEGSRDPLSSAAAPRSACSALAASGVRPRRREVVSRGCTLPQRRRESRAGLPAREQFAGLDVPPCSCWPYAATAAGRRRWCPMARLAIAPARRFPLPGPGVRRLGVRHRSRPSARGRALSPRLPDPLADCRRSCPKDDQFPRPPPPSVSASRSTTTSTCTGTAPCRPADAQGLRDAGLAGRPGSRRLVQAGQRSPSGRRSRHRAFSTSGSAVVKLRLWRRPATIVGLAATTSSRAPRRRRHRRSRRQRRHQRQNG